MTFRDRILELKQKVMAGTEPKPGKLWWSCWKCRYLSAEDESDGMAGAEAKEQEVLVVASDPPPQQAWDALCGLLQSKPRRDPILQYCRTVETLSKDECVILVQACKLLNPSCSNEHLKALMAVFQALHRCGALASYPEVVACATPMFCKTYLTVRT
eukprot:6324441-Amphidinium_carterae.1